MRSFYFSGNFFYKAIACFVVSLSFGSICCGQPLKAHWIIPGFSEYSPRHPCPVFHKTFTSTKKIQSAILYITAHGLYEAMINDQRAGNAYFTPGWTNYNKRLQYQRYDVTKLLTMNNEFRVMVADGWYRGAFGGDLKANLYGSDAALLLQLEIKYKDGSKEVIASDSSWQCSTGPVRYSGIYEGEFTDTRIKDEGWTQVVVKDFSKGNLVETISEPVTKQEVFKPVKILKGNIIDFGQNLAGWVQIKIIGRAGDTIKVYHAEALDNNGDFYTGNLREAEATDTYILNGRDQLLEPHFTYHGFQFARVEGFTPTKENCTAVAVHSNLQHVGSFHCSDPFINQLQNNIEWSLNSNFFDIPTDCPQRSERLGWTGDAQVFCRTAAFSRNVKCFFTKWLADLEADQGINGGVPRIIPDLYHHTDSIKGGVAGWSDAATVIPWALFEIYGDTSILEAQYASMKAWVEYIKNNSDDYLWKANGYGDWYAPGDFTSIPFIDQCFFAYSTELLINAATALGKKNDVKEYTDLLRKIKEAFLENYIDTNGKAVTHTQTAYVLALQFDLLPDPLARKAIQYLVELIRQNNDHLATGFLGTPYLLHVLTKYGYDDLAFTLLNQRTIPSWLYPVTRGATTIWEKWDAIQPNGNFDTCSLNHYAYGAVGDWLYGTVAGIQSMEPGYKRIKIAPHVGGGLRWVKASYQCSYGKIVSDWKTENNGFIMKVIIPAGTRAIIFIPGRDSVDAGPGTYHFKGKLISENGTNKPGGH